MHQPKIKISGPDKQKLLVTGERAKPRYSKGSMAVPYHADKIAFQKMVIDLGREITTKIEENLTDS
jgi:hypothetical protein